MKKDKLNIIKYPGSKRRFVDIINKEINKTNCDIYIEPFLSSGAVFLNLEKKFQLKIINDIDRNIIRIFNSFKECELFEFLDSLYKKLINEYGNWGLDKKVYYKFRDEMNKKYYKSDLLEEGFIFYFLSRSCINALFRFGPNGFNQSWGNRGWGLNIDKEKFEKIKKAFENTKILNLCFFDLIKMDNFIGKENILFFLDPPYTLSNLKSYNKNDNFISNKDKFCEIIKSIKGKVIYTDLYDDIIDKKLNWRIVEMRNLISIGPNKMAGTIRGKEVMYCNF